MRQAEADRKAEEARKEREAKKAARLEKSRRAQQISEQRAQQERAEKERMEQQARQEAERLRQQQIQEAEEARRAEHARKEQERKAAEEARRAEQAREAAEAASLREEQLRKAQQLREAKAKAAESPEDRKARRRQQAELARKILEAERAAEEAAAAFDSQDGANESDEETAVLTSNEISNAISEGVQISRLERRRRSDQAIQKAAKGGNAAKDGKVAKLGKIAKVEPEPIKTEQSASFGSKKWAIQGVAAGVATLVAVGVPILATNSPTATAAQNNLSHSYVGGEASQKKAGGVPTSLSGDANAQARSTVNDVTQESKENNDAPECVATGASGARAAFGKQQQQGAHIVMPLQEGVYRLSSAFGYRVDPIYNDVSMHAGQDFAASLGTPIHAVADGVVTHAGAGIKGRSSNLIIVKHEIGGKTYYTWYIHMYDNGVLVKKGDAVKAGQVIGKVGSNGNSTGPHLHLEVHDQNDQLMNPVDFLKNQKAVDSSKVCG